MVIFRDLDALEYFFSEGFVEDLLRNLEVMSSIFRRARVEHRLEMGGVKTVLFVLESFLLSFFLFQHFHHVGDSIVKLSINPIAMDLIEDHPSKFLDDI